MKTKVGLGAVVALLVVSCLSITTLFAAQGGVTSESGTLLQYRSGGHIMGFMPDKVYFASRDHALIVAFMGSSGNEPHEISSGGTGDGNGPKHLGRLEYENVWPGITLMFDKVDQGIAESTFVIKPGADVSKIRLKYNVPATLRENGTLKFGFSNGELTESAPVAWQEFDGRKRTVKVVFRISDGTVGFNVGKYDKTRPLIIDPTYKWHTFYGAGGDDGATSIALDNSGNIYVTGGSNGTWNGPSGQPPLHAHSGGSTIGLFANTFVLKLDSNGTYQWHTFYGGSNAIAWSIALDGNGNLYMTGSSADSWDGPSGQSPLHAYSDHWDIFVLKLNSNGAYQWHTFYGSSEDDKGVGIALDVSGNAYVTGTSSLVTGQNASWNGPDGQTPLHSYRGGSDLFVLKLGSNGIYRWHTFYGSDDSDSARALALDGGGNIYVTGSSFAAWDGPSGQGPLHAYTDSYDIYVLKLNNSGAYQWHTFYGSGANEEGDAIAIDSSSNIYVTGSSQSSWNGPSEEGPLHAYSSEINNIYILKLDSSGAYQWHTFYGANNSSYKYGLTVNCNSDAFITSLSTEAWNGPANESPFHAFSGTSDTFILKLDSGGTYHWHTFYGSDDPISGNNGIATDGSGNIHVAGYTAAAWNGDGNTSPLNAYSGGWDIFLVKLYDQGGQCGNASIQRGGSPINFYATVQDAYNAAADGDTIKLQAMEFSENLTFADNIVVSLQGGYNSNFVLNPGMTTLVGCLTINSGTVIIENLIIK